jgi:hypothetical protein
MLRSGWAWDGLVLRGSHLRAFAATTSLALLKKMSARDGGFLDLRSALCSATLEALPGVVRAVVMELPGGPSLPGWRFEKGLLRI